MHYVIGDVHGCYDQLMEMLNKIEEKDNNARFIFVGDFIDRGPKVWETLDWALENIEITDDEHAKYRSVVGNHEYMLIDWFNNNFVPKYERYVKENETLKENGIDNPDMRNYFSVPLTNYDFDMQMGMREYHAPDDVRKYIDFFAKLPFEINVKVNDKNYKIVHAWFSIDGPNAKRRYIEEDYVWDRYCHGIGNYQTDDIIVHGHTPTTTYYYYEEDDREMKICYRHNEIDVDGGCVFNPIMKTETHLCGLCLETGEEFYVPGPKNQNKDGVWATEE